jgi:hypothetical protein
VFKAKTHGGASSTTTLADIFQEENPRDKKTKTASMKREGKKNKQENENRTNRLLPVLDTTAKTRGYPSCVDVTSLTYPEKKWPLPREPDQSRVRLVSHDLRGCANRGFHISKHTGQAEIRI